MPPNNNNFLGGYAPQQQMQMQRNNDVLVVPVSGEVGAQNYPVAAGNTVLLTDFNAGFIWLKSTDTNGMFQNMRKFEVKEITPKPAQVPPDNFVLRTEFEQLQQSINQLIAKIGGSNNEPVTNVTNVNAKPAAVVSAGK